MLHILCNQKVFVSFAVDEVWYEVYMRYPKDTSCAEMPLYKGVSEDYMRS